MDYQGEFTGPQIDERLTLAGTAYQKPAGGIPETDLASPLRSKINGKLDKAVSFDIPDEQYLVIPSGMYNLAVVVGHEDNNYQPIFVTGETTETFKVAKLDNRELPVDIMRGSIDEGTAVLALRNNISDGIPVGVSILLLAGTMPAIEVYSASDFDDEPEIFADVRNLYAKPSSGIPSSDMSSGVQTSLCKADTALQSADLVPIERLIPAQASPSNQLADKNFVNSTVQTETATFRGNYDTFAEVPTVEEYLIGEEADNNDYMVVRDASDYAVPYDEAQSIYIEEQGEIPVGAVVSDWHIDHGSEVWENYICVQAVPLPYEETPRPSEDTQHEYWEPYTGSNPDYEGTWRFKYVPNGSGYNKYNWQPEYQVNEKPLTAAQLAALNSGITDTKVAKLDAMPATIPIEVFVATYGQTSLADIAEAANSKVVIAFRQNMIFYLSLVYPNTSGPTVAVFTSTPETGQQYQLTVTQNGWTASSIVKLEREARKVTTWQSTPNDNNYPSEKLVYDSLFVKGVISQTQTWTQAADGGYDYTIADESKVWGNIPKANIDLFVAAGATFNATTGYFELNGLTDISYEEMQRIALNSYHGALPFSTLENAYQNIESRTVFPVVDGHEGDRINGNSAFNNSAFVEAIKFVSRRGSIPIQTMLFSAAKCFRDCRRLKSIIGDVGLYDSAQFVFTNNFSLENITLVLKASVEFNNSPRLSVASILYMINNEAATSAITITLHATAYARATADADIQAALTNHPNVSLASA